MSNWSQNAGLVLLIGLGFCLIVGIFGSPSKDDLLIGAARRNDTNAILRLVREGASANATAKSNGRTALMAASSKGHLASVELLLELGAKTEAKDSDGRTALEHASANGFTNLVGLLKSR